MKKFFGLTLTLLFIAVFSFAQVMEGEAQMSQGTNNGLSIELPEGNVKVYGKLWIKYMKEYGKTKKVRKTKEYFSNDITIPGMSTNSVDVYTKISGNQITTWFDLGGAYLNSSEHDGYGVGEKILLKFALDVKKYLTNEELKAESKKLKKLEADLAKLQKRKASLEASIEGWKQKILEAEEEIGTNITNQEQRQVEIETQQGTVEAVKQKIEEISNF